jgi:hypothetical protein
MMLLWLRRDERTLRLLRERRSTLRLLWERRGSLLLLREPRRSLLSARPKGALLRTLTEGGPGSVESAGGGTARGARSECGLRLLWEPAGRRACRRVTKRR